MNFWDRYLTTGKRSINPINGLFLELCAHPYINEANFLKLKGDLIFWDVLYDHALTLIQENPWRAQTWFNRAEGDLLIDKKQDASLAYDASAFEYLSIGMRKEGMLAFQNAQMIESTPSGPQNKISP
jgi:hypothetical protein